MDVMLGSVLFVLWNEILHARSIRKHEGGGMHPSSSSVCLLVGWLVACFLVWCLLVVGWKANVVNGRA